MKNSYRIAIATLVGIFATIASSAQTHYGQGAGINGQYHAHFGALAGMNNVGNYNTFIGHSSGTSNTTGNANTFVGMRSGYYNTASGNTFVGFDAGFKNSSGYSNTFVGTKAGRSNETGLCNTFLGSNTGEYNISGSGNVVVGYSSNEFGSTGDNNTYVGRYSGYSSDGSFNTFVGNQSGRHNDKGGWNTFMGDNAGFLNKNGSANTFVGREAGNDNETGHYNVALGYGAGRENKDGQKNTYIGYTAGGDPSLTNATAIGAYAHVKASNCLVLGSNANVGIGTSAPTYQLHISSGAAAKAGSSAWTVASDSRLKENLCDFTDGLDLLQKIRPVWFQYNGKAGIETGDKKFVGIIAQEMQKVAPYTVGTFVYQDSLGNKTEYLDYDANAVTYILINSVKEQQRIIEDKEAKIQALESRLEKLERLVTASPGIFDKQPEGGVLEQNVPNGFSAKTSIKYFIPQSVKTAVIDVYTVAGVKVSSHPISERGAGELVLSADKYRSGVHVYDLVMDGKSLGAKKMVVE